MISAIFNAFKARLEAALTAAGEELPRHELGAWKLPSTSAPNQIIWVVLGGQIAAARQTGQGARALDVRQIATRNERVAVHIWGKGGFDETERLLNHFIAACRYAGTAYPFTSISTDWMVGQDMVTNAGRLCILTIEIRIPVTAEPIGVSHAPHTVTLDPTINEPS